MRGDLADAVAEYSADDKIEAELSARDPKNNDQLVNMFTVRAILGRTLALTGDVEAGIRDLQQAIDIARQVKSLDTSNSGVQENLALYQVQLSRLLRLTGDRTKAEALTAESLETFTALTKQDPANARWQREFAEAQMEQAAQLIAARQPDKARTQLQTALGILDPLLTKQPDDRSTLLATVNARLLLAALSADDETAGQLRGEALKAIGSVKSGGGDPRLLALKIEALLSLGSKDEAEGVVRDLWKTGFRDPGLMVTLRREQIDYPTNPTFEERLKAATRESSRPTANAGG